MDALLGNVVPAPATKLVLTGNLGIALRGQLVALGNAALTTAGVAGAAGVPRDPSIALVNALAVEITAVIAGLPVTTGVELKKAVTVALTYGKAITSGNVEDINRKRADALAAAAVAAEAAAPAGAIRAAAEAIRAAAAAGDGGAAVAANAVLNPAPAPAAARALYDATVATVGAAAPAGAAAALAQLNTDFSNIKWLAIATALNNIVVVALGVPVAAGVAGVAAVAAVALPAEVPSMNIRIIAHVIAFGNNSGLLPNAAINLQNLLNSPDGTNAAASVLGNPSVADLHNTILARLSEDNVQSLTNIFGKPLLVTLRNEFTGKLSVYDPYPVVEPVVNENSLDFDRFLPPDVLNAVLENRQKKFFPMARVNISPSYFGLFAPGNQLRFELQRGGASLDPNMPIEMRGRGSAVYGSPIKGGDYNNWQVVGNNAFISDKLEFALQTAIKRLGNRLGQEAKTEIQTMITRLKTAEKDAKEAAENLKTVVKAHQATGLTADIGNSEQLKTAATEYNNRIGKVAKVEGKLGRVYATLVIS